MPIIRMLINDSSLLGGMTMLYSYKSPPGLHKGKYDLWLPDQRLEFVKFVDHNLSNLEKYLEWEKKTFRNRDSYSLIMDLSIGIVRDCSQFLHRRTPIRG